MDFLMDFLIGAEARIIQGFVYLFCMLCTVLSILYMRKTGDHLQRLLVCLLGVIALGFSRELGRIFYLCIISAVQGSLIGMGVLFVLLCGFFLMLWPLGKFIRYLVYR